MFADRTILIPYLIRGALLWLATRALLSGALLFAGEDPLRLAVGSMIAVVAWSIAVGFIETHRNRERALLGNLGISPLLFVALLGVPALLGELAIRIAASTLT